MDDPSAFLILIIVVFVLFMGVVFLYFFPVKLYVAALSAGIKLAPWDLIGMRLRRIPPAQIIDPIIAATRAGVPVERNALESHFPMTARPPSIWRAGTCSKQSG